MRKVIVLLALFVFAAQVWAQEKELKFPPDLPPYGPLKPVSSPAVQQEQLPNGLTVWLLPRQGFPKLTFLLTVRGGFAADPEARPGITEFLADALDQGTKSRTAKQIAEQIQGAGGDLRIEPGADAVSLETTVLATKSESGLAVLADVAQNAGFPSGQVEIVRTSLANSLQRREAEASFLARRALSQAIFGNQPYAVTAPTQATISATTIAELQSEYARRFRPSGAMLLVVGDFQTPSMLAAIRQQFGSWHGNGQAVAPPAASQKQFSKGAVTLIPRANSVQTRFMTASLGPEEKDADYAAGRVAILVCGRRISLNIREDKGYAYSAGGDVVNQGAANLLLTAATVRNPVTGATWNELRYELDRMATTTPTTGEVDRAKHYLIGAEALKLQSQSALAERLGKLWSIGLPPQQIGEEGEAIEKVTGADVEKIGRERLSAKQMTGVAVGDGPNMQEQLAPLEIELRKPQQ